MPPAAAAFCQLHPRSTSSPLGKVPPCPSPPACFSPTLVKRKLEQGKGLKARTKRGARCDCHLAGRAERLAMQDLDHRTLERLGSRSRGGRGRLCRNGRRGAGIVILQCVREAEGRIFWKGSRGLGKAGRPALPGVQGRKLLPADGPVAHLRLQPHQLCFPAPSDRLLLVQLECHFAAPSPRLVSTKSTSLRCYLVVLHQYNSNVTLPRVTCQDSI